MDRESETQRQTERERERERENKEIPEARLETENDKKVKNKVRSNLGRDVLRFASLAKLYFVLAKLYPHTASLQNLEEGPFPARRISILESAPFSVGGRVPRGHEVLACWARPSGVD